MDNFLWSSTPSWKHRNTYLYISLYESFHSIDKFPIYNLFFIVKKKITKTIHIYSLYFVHEQKKTIKQRFSVSYSYWLQLRRNQKHIEVSTAYSIQKSSIHFRRNSLTEFVCSQSSIEYVFADSAFDMFPYPFWRGRLRCLNVCSLKRAKLNAFSISAKRNHQPFPRGELKDSGLSSSWCGHRFTERPTAQSGINSDMKNAFGISFKRLGAFSHPPAGSLTNRFSWRKPNDELQRHKSTFV